MDSYILKVFLAIVMCCMVNSAAADVLGIASTLQCALSNGYNSNSNAMNTHEGGGDVSSSSTATTVVSMEGGDAGDVRKEMLTSLVDYGCYCNIGMLGGTLSVWLKRSQGGKKTLVDISHSLIYTDAHVVSYICGASCRVQYIVLLLSLCPSFLLRACLSVCMYICVCVCHMRCARVYIALTVCAYEI